MELVWRGHVVRIRLVLRLNLRDEVGRTSSRMVPKTIWFFHRTGLGRSGLLTEDAFTGLTSRVWGRGAPHPVLENHA